MLSPRLLELLRSYWRWLNDRRLFSFIPTFVSARSAATANRGKIFQLMGIFPRALATLAEPRQFYTLLSRLRRQPWVVHAKPPFGGPAHVLKYLARYTHRVAMAHYIATYLLPTRFDQ